MFSELPIRQQLKNYSIAKLQADVLAGFTVAVTLIPQGLAYGSLARLPVQYGLYSGFIGGFIYLLFGTAKDITLGECFQLYYYFDLKNKKFLKTFP